MCKRSSLAAATLLLATLGAAGADPRTYALPEPTAALRAPTDARHQAGFDAALRNCMVCHSVDYIAMQPPDKGEKFWESEVHKMIKVYKAPLDEGDAKAIAAYLTATY